MGSTHTVDRSLIKRSSVSEKDVTLGLKMKYFDEYMDTIFPENFNVSLKKDLITKIKKRIKFSDAEANKKEGAHLNAESNIIDNDFYVFLYAFEDIGNDKINMAYQFINGEIEVSKSYEYKTFLGIKYGKNKYECITDDEKSFYKNYFDVKGDDMPKYLQEQKKYLLK